MKQILFATTAIFAWTGMAAADVTISGIAELGIFSRDLNIDEDDDGDLDTDSTDIEFFTDIDVTFTLSGATESGLVYGASIDLDESDGGDSTIAAASDEGDFLVFRDGDADGDVDDGEIVELDDRDDVQAGDVILSFADAVAGGGAVNGDSDAFDGTTQGGETIFISGGFGRLTMGDTDGAYDAALAEVGFSATAINDDHEHAGWDGLGGLDGLYDGQVLTYAYTIGDFSFYASGEVQDDGADDEDDPILGLGVSGSIDFANNAIGYGLGYQFRDNEEAIGVSLNGTFAGFQVGIVYQDVDRGNLTAAQLVDLDNDDDTDNSIVVSPEDDSDFEHFGIGIGYNQGPLSLHANYGYKDFDDGDEAQGVGLTAGYELGDGISLQFGYGYSDVDADDDTITFSRTDTGGLAQVLGNGDSETHQASFGVQMSF